MIQRVICVSNTVKESFILRTHTDAKKCIVIPNAIDTTFFSPKEIPQYLKKKDESRVRIVVLSRMTWRKGMDLLIELLPVICKKY